VWPNGDKVSSIRDVREPTDGRTLVAFLSTNGAYVHTQLRCKYHCKYTSKTINVYNTEINYCTAKRKASTRRYSRYLRYVLVIANALSLARSPASTRSESRQRLDRLSLLSRTAPRSSRSLLLQSLLRNETARRFNDACHRVARYHRINDRIKFMSESRFIVTLKLNKRFSSFTRLYRGFPLRASTRSEASRSFRMAKNLNPVIDIA